MIITSFETLKKHYKISSNLSIDSYVFLSYYISNAKHIHSVSGGRVTWAKCLHGKIFISPRAKRYISSLSAGNSPRRVTRQPASCKQSPGITSTVCLKKMIIELQPAILRELLGVWTNFFLIRKDLVLAIEWHVFHAKWKKVSKYKTTSPIKIFCQNRIFSPLCQIKAVHAWQKKKLLITNSS